jgi:hypothetical protein
LLTAIDNFKWVLLGLAALCDMQTDLDQTGYAHRAAASNGRTAATHIRPRRHKELTGVIAEGVEQAEFDVLRYVHTSFSIPTWASPSLEGSRTVSLIPPPWQHSFASQRFRGPARKAGTNAAITSMISPLARVKTRK